MLIAVTQKDKESLKANVKVLQKCPVESDIHEINYKRFTDL